MEHQDLGCQAFTTVVFQALSSKCQKLFFNYRSWFISARKSVGTPRHTRLVNEFRYIVLCQWNPLKTKPPHWPHRSFHFGKHQPSISKVYVHWFIRHTKITASWCKLTFPKNAWLLWPLHRFHPPLLPRLHANRPARRVRRQMGQSIDWSQWGKLDFRGLSWTFRIQNGNFKLVSFIFWFCFSLLHPFATVFRDNLDGTCSTKTCLYHSLDHPP